MNKVKKKKTQKTMKQKYAIKKKYGNKKCNVLLK